MKRILGIKTRAGVFYIGEDQGGRFHPIYEDESLGSYAAIWQATEDLALNATFSVLHAVSGELLDTSKLGIPADPSEWAPAHEFA